MGEGKEGHLSNMIGDGGASSSRKFNGSPCNYHVKGASPLSSESQVSNMLEVCGCALICDKYPWNFTMLLVML